MKTAAPHHSEDVEQITADLAHARGLRRRHLENQLVTAHLRLASHLAHRYSQRGIDEEDLQQVAYLALVKAVRRFSPDRGDFAPYATTTVQGELKKYFRDRAWSVRPPRRIQDLRAEISQAGYVVDRIDRDRAEQIAADVEAPVADVLEALGVSSCFRADSLDKPRPDGEGRRGDTVMAVVDDSRLTSDDKVDLFRSLRHLDGEDRRLLYLRFFEELTQQQIADRLGVSQMQISRRLASVLSGLRGSMSADGAA